jgi:hypothetical protein
VTSLCSDSHRFFVRGNRNLCRLVKRAKNMSLRAKNVHNVNRSKQVVSENKISPPFVHIVEVTKKPITSSKLEIPEDLALKDLESHQYLRYKMLKTSKPAYYDDEGSIESIEEEFSEGSMLDLDYFMIPEDIFA